MLILEPLLPVAVVRPQSYTVVLGIQRGTEIIRDNLGFMYYKNKVTDTKMWVLTIKFIIKQKYIKL